MKRIIYIPFDHLHRKFGAMKDADPKTDLIAFVESARMTTGRGWHKERLFFLISSARHFAASLEEEGFTVEYVKAAPLLMDYLQSKRSTSSLRLSAQSLPLSGNTTNSRSSVSPLLTMISS